MAYDPALVEKAARDTGLPVTLLERLIAAESSGRPGVDSPKGAAFGEGLTQLSEAAAKDEGVTDRTDPAQNVEGGARYLKAQIDRFGSEPLGLAAYNMGPAKLERAGRVIPASVRGYVDKVEGKVSPTATAKAPDTPAAPDAEQGLREKQIDAAIDDFSTRGRDYDAAIKDTNAKIAEREKLVEADIADIRKAYASAPSAPRAAKLPDFTPPPVKDPVHTLMQLMPLVLFAGSKMGRNKGLALMNSTAAVLKGAHDQNDENQKQAREDAKAKLDEFIEQVKLDHQRYDDLLNDSNMAAAHRVEEVRLLGILNNDDQLRLAGPEEALKLAHDRASMLMTAATQAQTVRYQMTQQEIEKLRLQAEASYRDNLLHQGQEKIEETRRYHDQQTPLQRAKFAEKLRNDVDKSALGKAYSTLDQYSHVIDAAEEKMAKGEKLGSQAQAAFLDAYTKIVTGGQAIRGFTLKLNMQHAGLADKAAVALQQLGAGGPLSPRQEREMVGVVREYTKALDAEYQGAIGRADEFAKKAGAIDEGESVAPFEVDPATLGAGGTKPAGDGWSIKPAG